MTKDMLASLSDDELQNIIVCAANEKKMRAEERKRGIIAKIKELAKSAGVSVSVEETKGNSHIRKTRKKLG